MPSPGAGRLIDTIGVNDRQAENMSHFSLIEAVAPDELKFAQILPLRRSGPEPLYYQLACSMEAAIAGGRLARGTKLPPEKDIARQLFLSTNTVRQAWAYLEGRGVIVRTKKVGTLIA